MTTKPISDLRRRMLSDTTARYAQVATNTLRKVRSPLDRLRLKNKNKKKEPSK